jgi:glucokinase
MQPPKKYLGIEIGGTKLQLLVSDADGQIEKSVRYTIDAASGAESIRTQISEGIKDLHAFNQITSIGVGFGGPVDWRTGTIRTSHQVSGWTNFNLSKWLNEITGKPVTVENDANTAALAEAVHGCGKGYDNVFYITLGSGIGGGMVIKGEIYHGKEPGEVEIGHLRLNKDGHTLESKCSGWAVDKKVKAFIDDEPGSLLSKLAFDNDAPGALLLPQALEKNDPAGKKIIDEVSDDLAFALSHVVHLFHPDIIIIGGGLSLLKEHLRQPIIEKLPKYLMQAFVPAPPVQMASLAENVVPIGALELAKRNSLQ